MSPTLLLLPKERNVEHRIVGMRIKMIGGVSCDLFEFRVFDEKKIITIFEMDDESKMIKFSDPK